MAAVIGPAGPSHLAAVPGSAEEFMEVAAVCLFYCFLNERPCRSWCWCVVLDVCLIQNLIGVVYVLLVVGRGLNLKVSGVDSAGKGKTTIRIGGGWWAAAAMRVGRGGGLCSNAPSLVGDLDGTTATAYANNGPSSLLGGYYYCGGVGGRAGGCLSGRLGKFVVYQFFWVCFVAIPM